jgi:hypothetical protein
LIKKTGFFVSILLFIIGCGEEKGHFKVWLIDAPPPQDVEHIYISVIAFGVINEKDNILTVSEGIIQGIDLLRLTGGRAFSLTYNYVTGSSFVDLEPGNYKGVWLYLAQRNWVVRDSVRDSLLIPVPADTSFYYELDENFTVLPGEYLTVVIDLDASKSVDWGAVPYEFTPRFRIFQASNAGFIRGMVKDASGAAVKYATVQAVSSIDTMTALSVDLDTTYSYCLMIPEGTYDISASAEGYTPDTKYDGVNVAGGSILEGFDFTLE